MKLRPRSWTCPAWYCRTIEWDYANTHRPIRFEWPKRIVYVIRSNRLVAAFLHNRAVVRGSISAAIVLGLVLFGVISFLWMVGPEVVSQDWLGIGKGHFSDSHISSDRQHAVFRRDSFRGTLRFAASTE